MARGLLEFLIAERDKAVQELHSVDDKKVDVGHCLRRVERLALRQVNLLCEEACHLNQIACVRAPKKPKTLEAVSCGRLGERKKQRKEKKRKKGEKRAHGHSVTGQNGSTKNWQEDNETKTQDKMRMNTRPSL